MRAVRNTPVCLLGVVCAAALLVGPSLSAGDILLEDNNAKLRIDPNSDAGMYDWVVDGTDHLARQWFWYRIGPTGGESPINTLSAPWILVDDKDSDPGDDYAFISYKNTAQGLQVDLTLSLSGGTAGSQSSDILENIRIINLTGEEMEVHFFEFCDLDVGGDANDDTAWIDPNSNRANQADDGSAFALETIVSGPPTAYDVALSPNLYSSLTDAAPTTLTKSVGPVGPNNVEWAFQWDFLKLAAYNSVDIGKNKLVIPEPGAISLILLGGSILALRRKRLRPVR